MPESDCICPSDRAGLGSAVPVAVNGFALTVPVESSVCVPPTSICQRRPSVCAAVPVGMVLTFILPGSRQVGSRSRPIAANRSAAVPAIPVSVSALPANRDGTIVASRIRWPIAPLTSEVVGRE